MDARTLAAAFMRHDTTGEIAGVAQVGVALPTFGPSGRRRQEAKPGPSGLPLAFRLSEGFEGLASLTLRGWRVTFL